jgi:hypothetical protein
MTTKAVRTTACALIAGALLTAAGGVIGQVVQASTEVSDDLFRYPWETDPFILAMAVLAVAFGLVFVGLVGLQRSGLAGASPPARIGLGLALAGAALFVVAHLASIPVREQEVDDTGAGLVGGLFALATVLTGIGLTAAGWAAARARLWEGWRRFTPLACGIWALLLVGLVFTSVMPLAIAVFAALLLAIGAGLLTRPTPVGAGARPAGTTPSIALR